MWERRITHVRRDRQGVTTHVGMPGVWNETVPEAIKDIENRQKNYYVEWPERRTEVRVVNAFPKYLRTDRDNTPRNNLDDLPTF
ncbi:DUF3892 domain-containing protein [Isoptericola haloaureus]|uniref:DUF3892 domain-containing protein n=1 Tax=Isoptericola haloaureus TaxID=1542902 RepID=A0ABU7Z7Z3_9MICO